MDGPQIRVVLGDAEAFETDIVVLPGRRASASGRLVTVPAPRWIGSQGSERQLAEAYRRAVAAANVRRARSMSLPAVMARSPWPLEDLTRVALTVLGSTPTSVRNVLIAAGTPAMAEAWAEALCRQPGRSAPREPWA